MADDRILDKLEKLNNEIRDIKLLLQVIVGDRAIGRSNTPGLIDQIIDCLKSIARN